MTTPVRHLANGALLLTAVAIANRALAVASQVIMGWRLAPNDFGLFAAAFATTSLLTPLVDGPIAKLLVQRESIDEGDLERFIRANTALSIVSSLTLALFLVLMDYLDVYALSLTIVMIMLASIVTAGQASIYRGLLARKERWTEISRIGLWSAFLQYSLAVGLAFLDAGAYALAVPHLAARMCELLLSKHRLEMRQLTLGFGSISAATGLVLELRWVVVAGFLTVLILQGEYMALNLLSPNSLGLYYFAFQLSLAIITPFTMAMQSVLLPTFSRIQRDRDRMRVALATGSTILQLVAAPICFVFILVAEPLVAYLWNGKWNNAIPLLEIMLISTFMRVPNPIGRATLEALSKWRTQALLLALDALLVILIAVVLIPFGLRALAIGSLVWRCVISVVQNALAGKELGVSISESVKGFLCVPAIAVFAWGISWMICSSIYLVEKQFMAYSLEVFIFLIAYALTAWLLLRNTIVNAVASLREPSKLGAK